MFIGEYYITIDEKGRIAVPAKFRAALKKGVVTRGLDKCLFMYPALEWEKLAERLSKLSISKANTRAFSRLMLAGAMDVTPDKQGRVIVPDYLREYAALGKRLVITGLYNRFEIWDEVQWKRYKAVTEKDSVAIAEQMDELSV